MRPRSLRLRLLAGGALAIAAALALAWLAMTLIFDRHIEHAAEADLRRQAVPLLAGLRLAGEAPVLDDEPDDPRFGAPTGGLYWQISTPHAAVRSRSLWDSALPPSRAATATDWSQRIAPGPFGQQVLLIERLVRPDRGGPAVTVQLGYDLGQLASPRREFATEMASFLALLWAALSAAAWLQVSLGLKPLGDVEEEVARLRGDAAGRLTGRYPREMQPLTQAIDALAAAREADLDRARRRAADLAHGLKTPLAALAAQSRRAREAGATGAAEGLDQAIALIGGAIEGELARTRVGLARGDRQAVALPIVERLIDVIEHTEAGERIAFAIEMDAEVTLPLAPDDAAELLGPLIENAARHARRRVAVTANRNNGETRLAISDDGPGIDIARHGDAVLRGTRLDTAGPGHGLGLAIARELAEATGGTLTLGAAELGGLEVQIVWSVAALR